MAPAVRSTETLWKTREKELGRRRSFRREPTLFPRFAETFNDVLVRLKPYTVDDPFLPRFHQFR